MAGSHSLWSPSSAKRWRKCPGSVVMNEGQDKASKEAAEGTVYHKVSELVLADKAPRTAHYIGAVMDADGFEFRITEEDADYAQEYVDAIRARVAEGCIVHVEIKTDTSETLGIPGQSGTIDARVFDIPNETLEIRDLKFGRGVKVYASESPHCAGPLSPGCGCGEEDAKTCSARKRKPNDQLFTYGWSELKRTLFMCNWRWLKLAIHQPRIGHYDEITLSREECEQLAAKLWADAQESYAAWQRYHEDATGLALSLAPSLEACRWCARGGSCAVRAQSITNEVDLPMTAKNLPLMSGPQLAAVLDWTEKAENLIRAVRAEALSRAEQKSPDAAPGWKLVEGRKGDRTASPEDVNRRASEAVAHFHGDGHDGTLPPELYTEPELKSVAQIERACKKLGALGKAIWASIIGDPEKGIASIITQASGRPTLVRDFDARPELAIQPVSFELRPVGEEFSKQDPAAGLMG